MFFSNTHIYPLTSAHSQPPEAWQVRMLMVSEPPVVNLGTLTGSFVFLLAFLWLRIQQLTRSLRLRDSQIEQFSAMASTIAPSSPSVALPQTSFPKAIGPSSPLTTLRPKPQDGRAALLRAIDEQELRVQYQPIVDLETSEVLGFEGLVRWQHPQRGRLLPADFLPLAEETGLIVEIDRWVLKAACKQLLLWQKQGLDMRPYISTNLSGQHLSQPGLAEYVQSLLSRYPISPQQLTLEVTEGMLITDPDQAIQTLRQIRKMGVSVSLDDFGTGYSSLSYLHRLPIDILKIDQVFVRHLCQSEKCSDGSSVLNKSFQKASEKDQDGKLPNHHEVIVQAILDLANGLDLVVVAEGISQDDQSHLLRQMGCHCGQGYLFDDVVDDALAQQLWPLR